MKSVSDEWNQKKRKEEKKREEKRRGKERRGEEREGKGRKGKRTISNFTHRDTVEQKYILNTELGWYHDMKIHIDWGPTSHAILLCSYLSYDREK